MRRTRSVGGFTLTELLVVMGIAAVLMAITVPVARNISSGNKGMACASRMQRIGQAIKMYALEEGGPPPHFPLLIGGNLVMEENLVPRPPRWGLQRLVDAGYLSGDHNLHCPADRVHGLKDPLYAHSYDTVDLMAAATSSPYGLLNRHKYMSCRGVALGSTDPDLKRQLTPLDLSTMTPVTTREWHPDDSTLVLWCDCHFGTIRQNRVGQYQALFWDGTVRRMDGPLFQGSGPADAWRVGPADDPSATNP